MRLRAVGRMQRGGLSAIELFFIPTSIFGAKRRGMDNVMRKPDETEDQSAPRLVAVASDQGIGKEETIYTKRFSVAQDQVRERIWQILCKDYFQRFVLPSDTVLDIGAGDGLFLRNIVAKRKIAVDLSSHVQALAAHGVEVHEVSATSFTDTVEGKVDVIFMSNFLEHLPNKRLVLEVLTECKKALKDGGMLMILQPNIRYVGASYWDYIDHHIALTEHSLVEALEVSGYGVVKLVPRFLPYTAKSKLGRFAGLVDTAKVMSLYLRFPILWKLFGQQTFVVAALRK